MPGRLEGKAKDKFLKWYQGHAKTWGLDSDPYNPLHKYDYEAAYKAGKGPDSKDGHWPSEYKADDHPNRFVKIKGQLTDTKYNKAVKGK